MEFLIINMWCLHGDAFNFPYFFRCRCESKECELEKMCFLIFYVLLYKRNEIYHADPGSDFHRSLILDPHCPRMFFGLRLVV